MITWEDIKHDNGFYFRRAKVFGGWIVNASADNQIWNDIHQQYQEQIASVSITFVPDPNHEWNL